jgi:hypothetical protein
MGPVWIGLIQMLFTWLSNDDFQDAVVKAFAKKEKDTLNAMDAEWVEGQAKSIKERMENKVPKDGNLFLEQAEIEKIKVAHRASLHEQV